jgi:hypothetical protein
MSDKKLLNENTIRRFMTLANVDGLTDNFISEMGKAYKKYDDEDKKMEESTEETVEETVEEAMDEEGEHPVGVEEADISEQEEMEDDMEDDMEIDLEDDDEELGEADVSLTEEEAQLLITLGERLKEAMMEEEEEEPMMADDDLDAEMPEEDEEMPEMPEEEGEEEEEEEEEEMPMQEELVQEVLRRVTQRIIKEKLARK